ncbi:RNA-binding cell elongation regulator Jag/EloR [Dialister invisus]|jgi:spoIIIJ-associated protein|uniref:RNA-binding cell elongation regulator Jag/EloR n=1 Tax=Dialister invisus TaxID=218538 RepID=UPI0027BAE658|nr:RNA-binding cell elongation regulator Jag/EloR [Dialister invisus]
MKTVRITAKTVDEAVEEGLKNLGLSRAEAVIRVIEQPSSGLFGLFNKKDAVVEVGAAGSETEDVTEPAGDMTSAVAGAADGEEETVFAAEEPGENVMGGGDTEEVLTAKKEKRGHEETPFSAEEQEEAAEEAKRFLTGVFKGMKMDVQLEKMVSEERILFNLHGEGLGILIGKHGQTLDALQYLTNLAANKNFRHHYFVLLDVEDYRQRRRQTLESLAHRLADKVKRTGEEIRLEPMSAGDRRMIHLALQNDGAVSTESDGEAPYRCVVIRAKQ